MAAQARAFRRARAGVALRIEGHPKSRVQRVGQEEQPFEHRAPFWRIGCGRQRAMPVGQPEQDRAGLEDRAIGRFERRYQPGGIDRKVARRGLRPRRAVHQNGAVRLVQFLEGEADHQRGVVGRVMQAVGFGHGHGASLASRARRASLKATARLPRGAPGARVCHKPADAPSRMALNLPITLPETSRGVAAMTGELSPIDKAKFVAAKRSVDYVEDGMRVGLGTGSTAAWMVRCLGELVRDDGLKIKGVPTSTRTAELAREVGIEVISLDEAKWLDLTIDGADEFDANLNLIKGGGGALLQEKIVATASDQMIVIADVGKEVETLGAFPLPIEVIPFGWETTKSLVEEMLISMDVLGRDATLRMNGDRPFVTDEGNYILDLHLGRIGKPNQLAMVLNQMPGVVENGLFIDICDIVIVGYGDGRVETRDINEGTVAEDRLDFLESDNLFSDLQD